MYRFHTCYSVNIAPRVHDFELKRFVDLMLKVRAGDLRHGESELKQLSMSSQRPQFLTS